MNLREIFFLIILAVFVACDKSDTDNPFVVDDDCLRGSGANVSETRELGNFTGILNTIPANVFITQGPLEAVRIEAQANILEVLKTNVENNTLSIEFDKCIKELNDVSIHVTIPEINKLILTGVGDMNMIGDIDVAVLDISLTGVGNFNLQGRAETLNIQLIGVGDVSAFPLLADIGNVNISGVGNTEVFISNELNVTITGVGTVFYKGSPDISSTITGDGAVINAN
ncbi:MAG: head GIN domain-containing protein [Flavobacteriaceae bacterium]